MTPEQKARDMMERAGWDDAQSCTAGDVVEIANVIDALDAAEKREAKLQAEVDRLKAIIAQQEAACQQQVSLYADQIVKEQAENERRRAELNARQRDLETSQTEVVNLKAVADALREQKGRLEVMEHDYAPGLPERRLADDLLDAIATHEAAEAAEET